MRQLKSAANTLLVAEIRQVILDIQAPFAIIPRRLHILNTFSWMLRIIVAVVDGLFFVGFVHELEQVIYDAIVAIPRLSDILEQLI